MLHEVRAELVGSILHVFPTQGVAVLEGDTIVILESMKMEIPVIAEVSGIVISIDVGPGSVVQCGDLIAALETAYPD